MRIVTCYSISTTAWSCYVRDHEIGLRFQSGSLMHSDAACHTQVVARCAISTTMGGCFGGTVGIIVQLIYTKISTGHAVW